LAKKEIKEEHRKNILRKKEKRKNVKHRGRKGRRNERKREGIMKGSLPV
jgi:hypothetical protein